MWRRQLPVWSPLGLSGVAAAGLALLHAEPEQVTARTVADLWDMPLALLTSSGTGALTLALRAAVEHRGGRPIALPAYGCYDLATAADGASTRVVLYDVDPTTLAPEPASLRAALNHGVSAVVVVHLFGIPVDLGAIRTALTGDELVIEDAAQGAGGRWNGRRLGSRGDLAVLSFGRGKGVTAGKGGALLISEGMRSLLQTAERGRAAARAGAGEFVQLAAQWLLGNPSIYALPAALPFLRLGETIYHAPARVRGASRAARGALPAALARMDAEAERRRDVARRLTASVSADPRTITLSADAEPGMLRLPMLTTPASRRSLLTDEARAHGIMPGYPLALCDLPGFGQRCLNAGDSFPGARQLADHLVTLPTHGRLSPEDIRWMQDRLMTGTTPDGVAA